MAQRSKGWGLAGLGSGGRRKVDLAELRRLEEKKTGLERATQHWVGLLREMEASGESGKPDYERYYRAYLDAKQLEKQADLQLFNVRQGLVSR